MTFPISYTVIISLKSYPSIAILQTTLHSGLVPCLLNTPSSPPTITWPSASPLSIPDVLSATYYMTFFRGNVYIFDEHERN
jgi:hypothetical protein